MGAASAPLPSHPLPPHVPQLMANHPPWPETHYTVLGLPPDCAQADIKQRYWVLSLKHRPEDGGDVSAFIRLRNAYSILNNPAQRKDYDTYLRHLRATAVASQPFPSEPASPPAPAVSPSRSPAPPAQPPEQSDDSPPAVQDRHDTPWVIPLPGIQEPHRSLSIPDHTPKPASSPHYLKAHCNLPQPLPQPPAADRRYIFEEKAAQIKRWLDKVVEANDRRARRYEGWLYFRRGQEKHSASSKQDQDGRQADEGSSNTCVCEAAHEPTDNNGTDHGKAPSSYATACSRRTQQSEPEPTWTELMSLSTSTGLSPATSGPSSSSTGSTSLPSGSSHAAYIAPPSALGPRPSITPSMSPTQSRPVPSQRVQPPPRRPARSAAPRPGEPSGMTSSITAVRETLQQCGDTPITRMLVAELDKLEGRPSGTYAYRPGHNYAEHYAGQVGQRQAGKLKILLLVMRTLIRDAFRRWFRLGNLGPPAQV